jgi:predicted permease
MSGRAAERLYGVLLRSWPADFRMRHGPEMEADFRSAVAEARRAGRAAALRAALALYMDAVAGGIAERRAQPSPAVRGSGWANLALDLHYTLRSLRRSPTFTSVAILTLGLGIGANAAVFQGLHRALLRPLPYPDADRLVRLYAVTPEGGANAKFAAGHALDLRASAVLDDVALLDWGESAVAGEFGTEVVRDANVSWNLLPLLGAGTAAGRLFTSADDRPGATAVVVLSHDLWRTRFGADPAVVGSTVRIQGTPHTVLGVLAAGFVEPGAAEAGAVGVWRLLPTWNADAERSQAWLNAFGRLSAGTPPEQAAAQLRAHARQLAALRTELPQGWAVRAVPLRDAIWGEARTPFLMALAATGFLLLVVVANLANLLFIRGLQRSHEAAVRMALGAGRGDLLRQRLLEAGTLCAAGMAAALLFAWWTAAAIHGVAGGMVPGLTAPGVDTATFAFAAGVAVMATILAAMMSEMGRRAAPAGALRDGVRFGASRAGRRLRSGFAVAQLALSAVLLVGAGLALRSMVELTRVDPGFEQADVLTFEVSLPAAGYPSADAALAYQEELLERLAVLPEVRAAGMVDMLPLGSRWGCRALIVEGRPVPADWREAACADARVASPGYFSALGIETLEGRTLAPMDGAASEPVAVVSRTLARTLFPDGTAVGRRVAWFTAEAPVWRRIVGVVADVRHRGPAHPPLAEIYEPAAQEPPLRMSFTVAGTDAAALAPAVRTAALEIDADVPLRAMRTMADAITGTLRAPRYTGGLLAGLAALTMVLAAMGVYGVLAQGVAERRREISVRLALGAGRAEVLRMVLGQGLLLAVSAVLIGLVAGAGAGGLMAGLLYGVEGSSPGVYLAVAGLLMLVAALASWVPAVRATRVAPAEAMRE